jgi:hypothetical protein
VGFSYCSGSTGCPAWNDTNTAVDNANFLCEFFALYPEFADRDFYLTGESCKKNPTATATARPSPSPRPSSRPSPTALTIASTS